MALDFDIRDPKNQKLIMTFLIPIVILAAVFQFVVSPLKEEVAAKNVELTNAQQQIDIIRCSLKTPELLREEKEQLELSLRNFRGFSRYRKRGGTAQPVFHGRA
jgi:Tfp pilus assembly protein PilO